MKKKLLLSVLSVLCFGLTSCGGNVIETNKPSIPSDGTIVDAFDGIITQVTEGLKFDFTTDKTGIIVTGYEGVSTEVFVPSKYNDLPVVKISDGAFKSCNMIRSVKIGKNVTSIGYRAFSWCSSLESITIPDSVKWIGKEAFRACSSLTDIEIPNSVTEIGFWAFEGCNSLQSNEYENWLYLGNKKNPYLVLFAPISGDTCIMHEQTKLIYYYFRASSFKSLTISNGITSIDDEQFREMDKLESVTIGNSVTSIGGYAFFCCTSLTTVYYTGTEEQWNAITIDLGNSCLTNANIIYNYEV